MFSYSSNAYEIFSMLLKMLLQMEQCASGQNTNTFGKVIYRLLKKRTRRLSEVLISVRVQLLLLHCYLNNTVIMSIISHHEMYAVTGDLVSGTIIMFPWATL